MDLLKHITREINQDERIVIITKFLEEILSL